MDYTKRTRKDWIDFDNAKIKAFLPTEQEKEQEALRIKEERENILNEKITKLWIQRPNKITKERALVFLQNINAKEFIWEDLVWRLENQEEVFWSFDKAFDDLVIKYL